MGNLLEKYRTCFRDKKYRVSFFGALVFLLTALVLAFFSIIYANERASGPVTDIILSNIPVFDVDGLFVYGPIFFWAIIIFFLIFKEPKRIPFALESIATFEVIRSIFVMLTHIAPFPTHVSIDTSGIWGVFTSGSDLFFSGHTGLPFLIALVFWDNKILRTISIAASVFFGIVVLLAHEHYSIDVFAAFFITYTIFVIAKKLFRWDFETASA